jgi:hypothetical protein
MVNPAIAARLARVEARFPPERDGPRFLRVVCDECQAEEVKRLVEEAGYGPNDICVMRSIGTPPASRDRNPVLPYVLVVGHPGSTSTDEDLRGGELFRRQIDRIAAEMRFRADATAIVLSPKDAEL